LINIQPSSALQGGIPFECLCGKMSDYSSLRLFGCVCYVLLVPRECVRIDGQEGGELGFLFVFKTLMQNLNKFNLHNFRSTNSSNTS
jgi:hypothetical protein